MKKTLKVIASAAIAMSAFASVAMADDAATTTSTTTDTSATTATTATKTSADFKDLATVDAGLKAKIDALLKAGVFEGTAADQFGINENMTRAQFAKVLDLIYGVNVDMTVKTSSFSDVMADDQANGWAIPYIEAAKKAGLIDGVTDTTFVPGDNVTLGQFATALVKGLGVKPDVTGTPWYADAVKQAIAKNVLPADTDGSKVATRADLVVGAYGGQQAFADMNKPTQVSVVSAKATGVKTVTVTFDRDVDTSKATLTLSQGGSTVATTTAFADDKKSATLTLTDTVLRAGDYTVTLGGLDASAIKTATGTFTAQDEQVQKIEFVSASDTIAQSNSVVLQVKATNQYGETAATNQGNYNVISTDFVKLNKADDGTLLLTLNTASEQAGIGIVSVTIVNNDSHVTATKNFKVGTVPILTKIELGTAKYSSGTSLTGTGQNVVYPLNMYDQYGSLLTYDALNTNLAASTSTTTQVIPYPTLIWNDYIDQNNVKVETQDDGTNMPQLKISLLKNVDKTADYNFTVLDQAASVSGKVSIGSSKLATKIQIGSPDGGIAAGDANDYIPITAWDAQGNQLSLDDLLDSQNVDRIKVAVSGATNATQTMDDGTVRSDALQLSGEHKGTVHITGISSSKNGAVSVNAFIATANTQAQDNKTFTIQGARVADKIVETTTPAKNGYGTATSKFKYEVRDQYNQKIDNSINNDSMGNAVTSGGDHYSVTVTATTYVPNSSGTLVPQTVTVGAQPASGIPYISGDSDYASTGVPAIFSVSGAVYGNGKGAGEIANQDFKALNNTFRFQANNAPAGSQVDLVLTLNKTNNAGKTTALSTTTKTFTVSGVADNLTYSVNSVPALWNALDSGAILDSKDYDGNTALAGLNSDGSSNGNDLLSSEQKNPLLSKFAREITVSAINAAGDSVAVPKVITGVSSGNTSVAQVVYDSTNSKAFVIGYKAGTTNLTVSYKTLKNETKTAIVPITVKSDALAVASMKAGNTSADVGTGFDPANNNVYWAMNLSAFDNYGVEYNKDKAQKYNYILGITFSVSNIRSQNSSPATASVDAYGNITASSNATFDVTATSSTGKSVTTSITMH